MLQDRLRAGEFDREIIILEPVYSVGSANSNHIDSWSPITNSVMMAKRTETKGTEVVVNDRLTFVQKTIFSIRYRSDVSTINRVRFDSVLYEIISVTETQGRRRFLDLVCNRLDTETT